MSTLSTHRVASEEGDELCTRGEDEPGADRPGKEAADELATERVGVSDTTGLSTCVAVAQATWLPHGEIQRAQLTGQC
jgi:hypothetical protein